MAYFIGSIRRLTFAYPHGLWGSFRMTFWVTLLLLGSTAMVSQAQHSVGVQAGSINTKFFGDGPDDAAYFADFGYRVGVQYNFHVTDDVILSVEPTFLDERGLVKVLVEPEPDSVFFKDSLDVSIKYLSFPVLAKIVTNNKKWHFTGGFDVMFPLTLTDLRTDRQRNALLRTANVSLEFGAAYRFPYKSWGGFQLEFRYSQSLVPITNDQDELLSNFQSTRTTFMLAYILPFFNKVRDEK
jgi:hypothetical protein